MWKDKNAEPTDDNTKPEVHNHRERGVQGFVLPRYRRKLLNCDFEKHLSNYLHDEFEKELEDDLEEEFQVWGCSFSLATLVKQPNVRVDRAVSCWATR